VETTGLRPATEYFYQFRLGSHLSRVGRTVTAPAEGASPQRLRFGVASCSQYEHGFFTAYRHLARERFDVVLHLGDYFYEYPKQTYVSPDGNVRDALGPETTDLRTYRLRHAQYKTDHDLQAAHASAPWLTVFDDHEVDNNWADDVPEDEQTRAQLLRRRAAAFQAYYEHLPLRRSSMPQGVDLQLFRRIGYGKLATFHMLDTRQYRTDQPCGDDFGSNCAGRRDRDATILGDEQEAWLFSGLRRSPARWNVLGQQVFVSRVDFAGGPGRAYNPDAWDGYVRSQNRLTGFLGREKPSNPVVLTGDVHAHWQANVLRDFDRPESPVVGAEFITTSITSGGNGSDTADYAEVALAENPHVNFFNNRRGYLRVTVTPDELTTDYRVVPYVTRPGAPVHTRATFVVENGTPGATRASTS
jgi:alkaline phosphatase D